MRENTCFKLKFFSDIAMFLLVALSEASSSKDLMSSSTRFKSYNRSVNSLLFKLDNIGLIKTANTYKIIAQHALNRTIDLYFVHCQYNGIKLFLLTKKIAQFFAK